MKKISIFFMVITCAMVSAQMKEVKMHPIGDQDLQYAVYAVNNIPAVLAAKDIMTNAQLAKDALEYLDLSLKYPGFKKDFIEAHQVLQDELTARQYAQKPIKLTAGQKKRFEKAAAAFKARQARKASEWENIKL